MDELKKLLSRINIFSALVNFFLLVTLGSAELLYRESFVSVEIPTN